MPHNNDTRFEDLRRWLSRTLNLPIADLTITPASSDASFRRYFRVDMAGSNLIAMDAPPSHEETGPFIRIAHLLKEAGIHAPTLHVCNVQDGFLLLEDFGSTSYLDILNDANADAIYRDAMNDLLKAQRCIDPAGAGLPDYNAALLHREMALFVEWFLGQFIKLKLDGESQRILADTFQLLADNALEQPQVFVHRDYHSRNLMFTETGNPGVIDFQDAVVGPITYDLVSLLRDCYIAWPQYRIDAWVAEYRQQLIDHDLLSVRQSPFFTRWFDWMGMQRHLKAIGIFARLKLRDGKPGYIKDIPRTLHYIHEVAGRYPELSRFTHLLEAKVLPASEPFLENQA